MSIFYKQTRIGQHGREFRIYKFRTMVVGADKQGGSTTSKDDERITPIGVFLRKWKIDELPQLINVIRGEMSLVGPRPTVAEVIETLPAAQRRIILSVKPGITDLASIWNSNEEEKIDQLLRLYPEKTAHELFMEHIYPEIVRLQIEYIKTKSFWGDIKIIYQTIRKIFYG